MSDDDLMRCSHCGAVVVDDAEVDYNTPSFGQVWALCADCVNAYPVVAATVSAILADPAMVKVETHAEPQS